MTARSWWRPAASVAVLVAALAAGGAAVADRWSQVSSHLSRVGPGPLAGAAAMVLLADGATVMAWRALLADAGARLPPLAAARVVLVSAAGKYLPGSVWPYLAQAQMGRRYGVPRSRAALVSLLTVAVALVTGLAVAAATLPEASPASARRYWPAFLAVPVLVALLQPAAVNRLLAAALRLARRPPADAAASWRGVGAGAGWSLVYWAASGVSIWLLVSAVEPARGGRLALSVGAYALAWSVGFLVVIAPAGAGIRELVLTATLSAVMPAGAALTVALLSRALTTAGDVALAAAAALIRPPAMATDKTVP